MGYIPANPHYAVVNCKIGDLNLTPIPPNALESFTYERYTTTAGNKFTIVVHDETAIIMESFLAEAAFKAAEQESYDFDISDMIKPGMFNGIFDDQSGESEKNDTSDKGDEENKDEDDKAQQTNLIGSPDVSETGVLGTTQEERRKRKVRSAVYRAVSSKNSRGAKMVVENESNLNSFDIDETNTITGTSDHTTFEEETPYRDYTKHRNRIDNSKLEYADPKDGIRNLYGVVIPPNVWVGEEALQEHSGGRGDD